MLYSFLILSEAFTASFTTAMMDSENTENKNNEENSEKQKESRKLRDSEYRFMDQEIRRKPVDWKKIVCRFIWIVVAGVLIGVIAAAVLVRMVPELKQAYASHKIGGTITISQDMDPSYQKEAVAVSSSSEAVTAAVSSSSGSGSADLSASVDSESGTGSKNGNGNAASSLPANAVTADSSGMIDITSDTGSSDETAENTPSTSGTSDGDENSDAGDALTLEQYGQLYGQMADLADELSSSLVKVTGITSEMDYFDQGYLTEREASGLIIAENSTQMYILTEYRIISDTESVQVQFPDGSIIEAQLRKEDTDTGLCVLCIPLDQINASTMASVQTAPLGNSYSVKTGEPVLALGSPSGYSDSVEFGAVTSVSSSAYLTDNVYKLLATDIKGAVSGSGVLVNMDGKIIGIIDQSLNPDDGENVTALAISGIKSLIEALSNNDTIPYLGITGQEVSENVSQKTGMPVGVLVTNVVGDSPAMLSGLKTYDVITEISGRKITSFTDYHNLLYTLKPGDVITITAMRKGADGYAEVSFSASVGAR